MYASLHSYPDAFVPNIIYIYIYGFAIAYMCSIWQIQAQQQCEHRQQSLEAGMHTIYPTGEVFPRPRRRFVWDSWQVIHSKERIFVLWDSFQFGGVLHCCWQFAFLLVPLILVGGCKKIDKRVLLPLQGLDMIFVLNAWSLASPVLDMSLARESESDFPTRNQRESPFTWCLCLKGYSAA